MAQNVTFTKFITHKNPITEHPLNVGIIKNIANYKVIFIDAYCSFFPPSCQNPTWCAIGTTATDKSLGWWVSAQPTSHISSVQCIDIPCWVSNDSGKNPRLWESNKLLMILHEWTNLFPYYVVHAILCDEINMPGTDWNLYPVLDISFMLSQ